MDLLPRTHVLASAFGLAALALDPSEVAPAGVRAGEERELELRAAGRAPAAGEPADAGASGPAHLLLQVASGPPPMPPLAFPTAPGFAGRGTGGTPGSGCSGGERLDDPDPGADCGFPGSPCP